MTFRTIASSLLVVACGLVVAGAARAERSHHDEARRIAAQQGQARLTLAQAVTIAEVRAGGRAIDARLSDGEVYTLRMDGAAQGVRRVRIAAYGGELLASDPAGERRAKP